MAAWNTYPLCATVDNVQNFHIDLHESAFYSPLSFYHTILKHAQRRRSIPEFDPLAMAMEAAEEKFAADKRDKARQV